MTEHDEAVDLGVTSWTFLRGDCRRRLAQLPDIDLRLRLAGQRPRARELVERALILSPGDTLQ